MGAGPRQNTRLNPYLRSAASLFVLFLSVFVLFGCGKKPLSAAKINAITQDLVAAAQSADGRNAQISIRPEMNRSGNNPPKLIADDISIELVDPSRRVAVERILDYAAARHHLKHISRSESSDTLEFDYLLDGQRTHSIRIVFLSASKPLSTAPRLAIIIDDIGADKAAADTLLNLPYPLTLSVLPGQTHSTEIANEAYHHGDQVMLHLPMQFQGTAAKAEPVELRVGMRASQVNHLLDEMLAQVPHVIGVNNHEGSLATAQPQLMAELMSDLRRRSLFFIDSRTTAATVAYTAAERAGVPAASRKVFLDDVETREAILRQLDLAVRDATEDGSAIAIGHPHPATIAVLAEGLPRAKSHVRLVFASTLVH